jgi:hypothetical protein
MKRTVLATIAALALIGGVASVQAGENDLGLKASGNAAGPGGDFRVALKPPAPTRASAPRSRPTAGRPRTRAATTTTPDESKRLPARRSSRRPPPGRSSRVAEPRGSRDSANSRAGFIGCERIHVHVNLKARPVLRNGPRFMTLPT